MKTIICQDWNSNLRSLTTCLGPIYQSVDIVHVYPNTYFGSNPTNRSRVIAETLVGAQTGIRTSDLQRHASNPYQSVHIVHVYPHTNFGANPTNSSRVIAENVCYAQTGIRASDLSRHASNSYQSVAIVHVCPSSKFCSNQTDGT